MKIVRTLIVLLALAGCAMAIAGHPPDEAVPFWERTGAASGGSTPEFPGTHPPDATRIAQLRSWMAEAKDRAARFGVQF